MKRSGEKKDIKLTLCYPVNDFCLMCEFQRASIRCILFPRKQFENITFQNFRRIKVHHLAYS